MSFYRLYARHTDGKTSVWDAEFDSYQQGCAAITEAIKAETGSPPLVILTLVTPGFTNDD